MSKWDEVEIHSRRGPLSGEWSYFVRLCDWEELLAHCKSLEAAQPPQYLQFNRPSSVTEESK